MLLLAGNFQLFSQNCRVLLPAIDSAYTGECKRGLAHGNGTASRFDYFSGEFKNGLPHGLGRYVWRNGDVFEGSWYKGKREGLGQFTPIVGKSCEGTWKNDQLVPSIDADDFVHEYRVKQSTNIEKATFRRSSATGNTINIRFFRNSTPAQVFELNMIATSGDDQANADFPVFAFVEFPFAAKLVYKIPDKGGAVLTECMLEFVIMEPGDYDVLLFH